LITALYVLWIVSGIVRWGALGKGIRVLVAYLGIALVSTSVTYWMGRSNINNLWVLHLYTLLSTLVLLYVFVIWENHPAVRRVMSGSAFFFAVIWGLSKLFLEDFALFDSFTMPLAAVLLVSAAVRTLWSITGSTKHSVVRDARFWVAVGVIIECCTTVLSFSAGNLLLADRSVFLSLFGVYWIASVVYVVCYGAALFSRHNW
jgi:hypothetical protein